MNNLEYYITLLFIYIYKIKSLQVFLIKNPFFIYFQTKKALKCSSKDLILDFCIYKQSKSVYVTSCNELLEIIFKMSQTSDFNNL